MNKWGSPACPEQLLFPGFTPKQPINWPWVGVYRGIPSFWDKLRHIIAPFGLLTLSIYLSFYLSIYLSTYLSIYTCVCVCVCHYIPILRWFQPESLTWPRARNMLRPPVPPRKETHTALVACKGVPQMLSRYGRPVRKADSRLGQTWSDR